MVVNKYSVKRALSRAFSCNIITLVAVDEMNRVKSDVGRRCGR